MKKLSVILAISTIIVTHSSFANKLLFKPTNTVDCTSSSLPFHAEFCASVKDQIIPRITVMLQSLMGANYYNYNSNILININEEQPVAPTKENPDVDQTIYAPDNLQFDNIGLYPNNSFIFSGNIHTLGGPAIAFISDLAQVQTAGNTKDPFSFLNDMITQPYNLDPFYYYMRNELFDMGGGLAYNVFQYQQYQSNPYNFGLTYFPHPFTVEQFNNQKTPEYANYWGVAAGGGSGGGFTIAINSPDNVVLAGGMGGGGGFSSPGSIQYESDNATVKSINQTASGSSAGGGVQIVASSGGSTISGLSNLTDGLGFGGGVAMGDGHDSSSPLQSVNPILSYYPDSVDTIIQQPVDSMTPIGESAQAIRANFASQLSSIKSVLQDSNQSKSVIVKIAGGMGVGVQFMYYGLVDGSTDEYRLQEYLPHTVSSGASFTVSITLTPKENPQLQLGKIFTATEEDFYSNLDRYYTEANKSVMQTLSGHGGYLCSYYICKATQAYIVNKAIQDFGSQDKIPSWLKIDTCNFQVDSDPNVCPTPPSMLNRPKVMIK